MLAIIKVMNNDRVVWVRGAVLGVLALFALLVYVPEYGGAIFGQDASVPFGGNECEEGKLCVSFLDVGQGDAIFIESPTGTQLLIDGGRGDGAVLREIAEVMGYFDRVIDVVIATHPDADHIGGLVDILERYDIDSIVMTENESDSAVATLFKTLVSEEGADVHYARRGQTIDLGGGAIVEILFPEMDSKDMESNASSIVAQLTYGETEVLLTGDSPKRIEEYLVLAEGEHLQSDVLKVGHHGSRTSTSELFLAEVDPDYAIISAGADNSYGHPHVEVTDMLFNYGALTKNTAEEGSIYMVSDRETIEFR